MVVGPELFVPRPAGAVAGWWHPFPTRIPITTTFFEEGGEWAPYPGQHRALDFGAGLGADVRAVGSGTIVQAGPSDVSGRLGNTVRIDHGWNVLTYYCHLQSVAVSVGTWVVGGQTIIGAVGGTGEWETQWDPHLHVELWGEGTRDSRIDPEPFIGSSAPLALTALAPVIPPTSEEEEYFVDSGYYIRNASWNISWYSRVTGRRRALQQVEWDMLVAEYGGNSAAVPLVVMTNAAFNALPAYV